MEIKDTILELFEPTFEAVGDSDLTYSQKRELLYNLYCFACAIYPDYAARPCNTLFEYGCCFLIEPERHPDYAPENSAFKRTAASADVLPGGGRWYVRRGKDFIKYDYGSTVYQKLCFNGVIPEQDRSPIAQLSLYAAVYCACELVKELRPLWYVYYFYLDATNEPVEEEYDDKLFALLHEQKVYDGALTLRGASLIGDEAELDGSAKLLNWYKPFIDYRREHIFPVLEKRMAAGEYDFVYECAQALLSCYPDSVELMNWYAAAYTERVVRDRAGKKLPELVRTLRELSEQAPSSVTLKRYLTLAELTLKNLTAE